MSAVKISLKQGHALVYLASKGDVLFGKGTAEFWWWFDTMQRDLLEGTCKNLIEAKLKQTGAKWRRDRADRMGIICSIYCGDQ